MILGLDVSTTCAGWCFSENDVLIDCGFIDTSKLETSKEKSFHIISVLEENPLLKKTSVIHLEAALSGFAGGFTSQQVIIKLSRFNAIFEYIISEKLNIPVKLLNVNSSRKSVFGKCRVKGIKSKDFVQMSLEKLHDIHKFDIINSKGNPDKRNSDMYDAMVLSLAK